MARFRLRGLCICSVVSLMAISRIADAATILTNGGFETPVLDSSNAPQGYLDITAGNEAVAGFTGWTITTNGVDIYTNGVLGSSATVYEGVQALDLVGFGSAGGISQSFSTVIGQQYSLSFAYGHNGISTTTASAEVLLSDTNGTLLDTIITHDNLSPTEWVLFSQTFTASASTTTLSFTETVGGNNGGVVLDAVSVDEARIGAVPEPSSFALLGLGSLGLAINAYRQRRTVSA